VSTGNHQARFITGGCPWSISLPTKNRPGVYEIRNKINGRVYVGSASTPIRKRWDRHLSQLRSGKHHSATLQRSWNKYGESSFAWTPILNCSPEWAVALEQIKMDASQCFAPSLGFNVERYAYSSLGRKMGEEEKNKRKWSPEHKEKMLRIMAEWQSKPEVRRKMAESSAKYWKNPRPDHHDKARATFRTPEYREAMSNRMTGRKHTEESKRKVSEAIKRLPKRDAEWCGALSKALIGRVFSDETRAKMSASQRARTDTLSQEARKAIGDFHRGRKRSAETKERLRLSALKREAAKREKLNGDHRPSE